jgi:hypothetical protein
LKKALAIQLPQETQTLEFLHQMIAGGSSSLNMNALRSALSALAMYASKPIVLFIDEIDSLKGHLVIFDRDPHKSWEEKIYPLTEAVDGKTIQVWGR